ncbi:MAG: mycothiol synthase [Ilumatobacteraceae bacterium]
MTSPTPKIDLDVGHVAPHNRSVIDEFCQSVEMAHGHRILSDQLRLDLLDQRSTQPPLVAVASIGTSILAVAIASHANDGWVLEVVSHHDHSHSPSREVITLVVNGLLAEFPNRSHTRLTWWARAHDPWVEHIASSLNFVEHRKLHQMRIPLTTDTRNEFWKGSASTRSFVLNQDEDDWLAINNSAFASHEEQGGWSREQLARRLEAPWFRSDDVRLYPTSGAISAFCWTKRHEADLHEPELGEIYAIAVDPSKSGMGLGKQMVMAGFSHLADTGIQLGMLYVDADNTAAMKLYESIGMEVHHTDRAYRWLGG